MHLPEDEVNEVLLRGVHTKWLMSNLRSVKDMKPLYGGYLFGVCDIFQRSINGESNPVNDWSDMRDKEEDCLRVGVIGLVEENWIESAAMEREVLHLENAVEVSNKLVKLLKGELKCDIVVALTHMLNKEDVVLQDNSPGLDLSKFHNYILIYS